MLVSMTGFASVQGEVKGYLLRAEARALNHRFFEFRARVPVFLNAFELEMESLAKKFFERGKIELNIFIEKEPENLEFNWSRATARAWLKLLEEMRSELGLKDEITLELLLSQKNVMIIEPERWGKESWAELEKLLRNCFEQLALAREQEGKKLEKDLLKRLEKIKQLKEEIEKQRLEVREELKKRIESQVKILLSEFSQLEEKRLEQEVAYLSFRTDISEELVRISSHLEQFHKYLAQPGAKGKKLDFLSQELNREFNTISAKAQNAQVSHWVVEAKSELEKIREQLHNIE